ncbi:MAG: hypothetical protein Q8Q85_14995 [Gemmatimonadales bacterium]|nr:hypothetical protein [Gemmatimonadales bacterium]
MRFWDASALVPLHVAERRTADMRALFKDDEAVVVWWGTVVECASALARQHRRRTLLGTIPSTPSCWSAISVIWSAGTFCGWHHLR